MADAGAKPSVQLFLAPRRPALDRAAASDGSIQIGRTLLSDGYALEAVIPWKTLGFASVPDKEFGLELQVDFAAKGQRRTLQMVYATGTNEAYVKSDHFLKASIVR